MRVDDFAKYVFEERRKGLTMADIIKSSGYNKKHFYRLMRKYGFAESLLKNMWTTKEVELIKSYYSDTSKEEMVKLIPLRTWEQIKCKAWDLGLKMSSKLKAQIDVSCLTEGEKGYIAGFVDGEGTIGMSKYVAVNGKIGLATHLTIANTNREVLEWLKSKTRLKREFRTYRSHKINRKSVHAININRMGDVLAFLTAILPYLIVKKKQAELMVEYCRGRLSSWPKPLTEKDLEFYSQIKALNKRGL